MFCLCLIFIILSQFFLSSESDLKTSGDDVDPSEVPLRQCPSGIHDSDVVLIHKCACVISEDEHEQYEACLNNAR